MPSIIGKEGKEKEILAGLRKAEKLSFMLQFSLETAPKACIFTLDPYRRSGIFDAHVRLTVVIFV